jgi:hypothetical protein
LFHAKTQKVLAVLWVTRARQVKLVLPFAPLIIYFDHVVQPFRPLSPKADQSV